MFPQSSSGSFYPANQASPECSALSNSLKRSTSTPGTLCLLKSVHHQDEHYNVRHRHPTSPCSGRRPLPTQLSKIPPEDLAKQMTLIDWSIFSCISRNELKPGQWTGPMKHIKSPNVAAFTRRFNNISFWVIEQILQTRQGPKQRAETIGYFIKVASALIDHNNLHSSYAIKSALSSAAIHRLEKTWAALGRKEAKSFEKLKELFDEFDNNQKLRACMENILKTPASEFRCIPNLAPYLRDIVHIVDFANSKSGANDSLNHSLNIDHLESVYRIIERCQQSSFDFIDINEPLYDYLYSICYIEELQKFVEEDFYKLSIKLEPEEVSKNGNKLSIYTSQMDISKASIERPGLSKGHNSSYDLSNNLNRSFPAAALSSLTPLSSSGKSNWKPGHRKTNSYEATAFLINQIKSSTLSTTASSTTNHSARNLPINLIDDSPCFPDFDTLSLGSVDLRTPRLEMAQGYRCFPSDEDFSFNASGENSYHSEHLRASKDFFCKGIVGRKVVLKNGKKPSIALWYNNFMALTKDAVLLFSSKSCPLNGVNPKPTKVLSLDKWKVSYLAENGKANVFKLYNRNEGNAYKFRTQNDLEAREWAAMIDQASRNLAIVSSPRPIDYGFMI